MRRHLLTALGLNAVPAFGWFVEDWSAGTTLLLYWLETLVGTLLIAGRILLHRRRRPSEGHGDYRAPEGQAANSRRGTYLAAFLPPTLLFTLFHGIFLAGLGFIMNQNQLTSEAVIDWRGVLAGGGSILFFQAVDFLLDAIGIGRQPFRWIERLGQQNFGRLGVVHLTILGGMGLVVFTGTNRDFFGVFIFFKTLLNCGAVLPQWHPKTPPAWISNLMDRIGTPEADGTKFADYWRKSDEEEEARIARNEREIKRPGR